MELPYYGVRSKWNIAYAIWTYAIWNSPDGLWNILPKGKMWNKIRSFICRRNISYAERISYYEVIFHSFRKERISLKKTIAFAIVFFTRGPRYPASSRVAPDVKTRQPRWGRRVWDNDNEIFALRQMWNNALWALWNLMLRIKWNEINPHTPAGISHGEAISHTAKRYFTNPVRDLFRWKRPMLCIKA